MTCFLSTWFKRTSSAARYAAPSALGAKDHLER
jgi:hypothetical protein